MIRMGMLAWLSILLWPLPTAWGGEVETLTRIIEWEEEQAVDVRLRFGAGQIEISKGDKEVLLEAEVNYDPDHYNPSIQYDRRDDKKGVLVLRTHRNEGVYDKISGVQRLWSENTWTLRFSPKVALSLEAEMGAGSGVLDLTGLRIRDLDMKVGASAMTVIFEEPNREEMEQLSVETGASKLRMKGLGYANFRRLNFRGGMGQFVLDFSGELDHPAEARISTGVGAITILIPGALGTRIETSDTFLTSLSLDRGFRRVASGVYENSAYGESKGSLDLEIEGGLGSINVEWIK